MPDSRFFETLTSMTVAEAVAIAGAVLESGSEDAIITDAAPLGAPAGIGSVVYCEKASFLEKLSGKPFGLCVISESVDEAPIGGAVARAASPRLAFSLIAERLHRSRPLTARADPEKFGAGACGTAVIAADAVIGEGAEIGSHAYIGPGVVIGGGARIGAGASITHALIGANCRILPGARIGQAGFGFTPGRGGLVRVPQLGRVVIGDDVEIGANTTVDRGALEDTHIGNGTKIDNLVQIGHNATIGRNCVIAALSGVSGSCVIGDGVMIGGQVGLIDHLTIGDGAQIAAGSGLMRDVPAGEKWGGRPARPIKDWLREAAALSKLAKRRND